MLPELIFYFLAISLVYYRYWYTLPAITAHELESKYSDI